MKLMEFVLLISVSKKIMRDQLRSTLKRRNLVKEENLLGNTKYFIAIGIVSKLFNELEFDTPCIGRVYTLG